jgi:hypothetical protein
LASGSVKVRAQFGEERLNLFGGRDAESREGLGVLRIECQHVERKEYNVAAPRRLQKEMERSLSCAPSGNCRMADEATGLGLCSCGWFWLGLWREGLGFFDEGGEAGGVANGEIGEHLAVNVDSGSFQAVNQLAVG